MTHGGLFEGVGGFALGAHWAGIETLYGIENNNYKQNILKQHFPRIKLYGDITKTQAKTLPPSDIITGGFPCQDISLSGHKVGIIGARSSMWTEMYRIVEAKRPQYVIIENSPQLLNAGFEYVLYDLAAIGYDAQWQVLSSAQFGLRHLRRRLFVIAHPLQDGWNTRDYDIFRPLQKNILEEKIPKQTVCK